MCVRRETGRESEPEETGEVNEAQSEEALA